MHLAGRILFAIAIVGFGILCLAYLDFIHQLQPVPSWVPAYGFLAVLTGSALIVAGLAIMADAKTYSAAVGLVVLFAFGVVFLQVPSAFADPSLLRSPWWVRTFETVALTGGAMILAGLASQPVGQRWVHIGRILFGGSMPVFGILHLIYAEGTASIVPPWYPWPLFWAYFTGAAHIAGGLAIATGVLPRLAATLAGVMFGTWALTLHIPSQFEYANPRGEQTSLLVAIGMCGAAWIVAGSLARQGTPEQVAAAKEPQLAHVGVNSGDNPPGDRGT